jgi:hypothetical protein
MVIIRTSAEDVSIHAVSPESILGAAAKAGVASKVVQATTNTAPSLHPPLEGGSKFAKRISGRG